MLCAHMFVAESFRFFRCEVQNALAFLAERHFHRSRNAFAHSDARLDFFSDGFNRAVGAQETIRQRLILAQKSQQQVLCLNVGAAILARLSPRKKDYASSFLCIAFKHESPALSQGFGRGLLELLQRLRNLFVCCPLALTSRALRGEYGQFALPATNCELQG